MLVLAKLIIISMAYGGHNETFVEVVNYYFICSICTLPLRDAIQTDDCGYRFYCSCFDQYKHE